MGGSKDGGRGGKNTDRTPIEFIGYAAMRSMECHCQAPKAGSGRGALLFSPSRFKASSLFYLIHTLTPGEKRAAARRPVGNVLFSPCAIG